MHEPTRVLVLSSLALAGCPEDTTPIETQGTETGSGDGDTATNDGDGDGDPTGDGDGEPTTGDGDGDPTTGDGDGDGEPVCGDGIVEGDEECDSGAANANDAACKADCTENVCGDGYQGPGEGCDDGNGNNDDECTNECALASCGDGITQMGEECDDGNDDDSDACTNACTLPVCGDGLVQAEEGCDEGPDNSPSGACTPECQAAMCGDGYTYEAGGEVCDDANQDNTDACTELCELPACGDGWVQEGEECDDDTPACQDDCTSTGWRVVHSQSNYGFRAMWASSPTDVWGVSSDDGIVRFDGEAWSIDPSCPVDTPVTLDGTGPDDVWVVGANGAAHWDGQGWALHELGVLFNLFVIASDDVWTFGNANGVFHWNGVEWSSVPSPLPDDAEYWAAYGATSGDIWFSTEVGNEPGFVRWFEGELIDWIYFNPPATGEFWGPAPDDIWSTAGGDYHWDGVGWSAQNIGPIDALEIRAYGPDDLWIANGFEAAYWDGGAWTIHDFPQNFPGAFLGLSGGTDAWFSMFWEDQGRLRRLRDGSFRYWFDSPLHANARKVWGTAANDVWMVGTQVAHYDGQAWTRSDTFTGIHAETVWAATPDNAWIGGSNDFHHWDGVNWSLHSSIDPLREINSMWGAAPDDIWATAFDDSLFTDKGWLYHFDGNEWSEYIYTNNESGAYHSLWGLSDSHIWVGQSQGSYLIYDGFGWVLADDNQSTHEFWGAEPYDILTVPGSMWRYNQMAGDFELEANPPGEFRAIWGMAADDIWALGDKDVIYHFDGQDWVLFNGPVIEERIWRTEAVETLWGIDGQYFAGGRAGLILQRP